MVILQRFWADRWLQGRMVVEWAPNLVNLIPKRLVQRRTVSQAPTNRSWVTNMKGALTVQVIVEYLLIWDLVDDMILQPDNPDQHCWKLSSSGSYSCKSAYNTMFIGTIVPPGNGFGRVERLLTVEEFIHHILTGCVLAREVWSWILRKLRLHVVPLPSAHHFGSLLCLVE
ncbi:hypothetical protein U9M48_031224 [Paspalum notatum var. saurae]|uniref:Uncharacterized protein n=1 Tax=Paspalum notatum var. saurae TaxID=547442 RepID=A0AAQ3U2D5_PASNO